MAEERQDSSPLDSTANVAMQTAKQQKTSKADCRWCKSAKMQQKALRLLLL